MAEGLKKGDKVRLTSEAVRRGLRRRKASALGEIASSPRAGSCTCQVRWDDCSTAQSYHKSFIERAPDPDPAG